MVSVTVEPGVVLPRGADVRLRARAARAVTAAGVRGADLSVVLCGDASIRALNQRWRNVDKATDVLSFSQDDPKLLGDVVISVETAARRKKRTLDDELFFLLVHGLCHLLGHDHATTAEARRMFALERAIRSRADRPAPRRKPGTNRRRAGRSSPRSR
jgi:probable rRNA maturation factor